MKWLSGWRTYALCALLIALAVLKYFGIEINFDFLAVVAGLAGITLRKGSKNDAEAVAVAVKKLIDDLQAESDVNSVTTQKSDTLSTLKDTSQKL